MQTPKILIVTPARDEERNIKILADSLESQTRKVNLNWIVVDDGSVDKTSGVCKSLNLSFELRLIRREKSGKLITGGAFAAWWAGVDFGLAEYPDSDFIMKLDADVELSKEYFECLFDHISIDKLGIAGGTIIGTHREQNVYVPGPVKLYSREALNLVRALPVATGFDVMDAILCQFHGLTVQVIPSAQFRMNRKIGHSEGLLHGCYRNGMVCRWVGYAPEYFTLHAIRHFFRSPLFLGSIWMLYGFIFTSKGPYPPELREAHRRLQRQRLRKIIKQPIKSLQQLYYPR
jgi:hypothetical protein